MTSCVGHLDHIPGHLEIMTLIEFMRSNGRF